MKKFTLLSVLLGTLSLVLSGCGLDDQSKTNFTPEGHWIGSLDNFFAENELEALQSFYVPGNAKGTLVSREGTRITFTQGFVNANGSPINGNVTVQLIEAYSKGDMVLMNKRTVARINGNLLLMLSGGHLLLRAYWAGTPVVPNPNGKIEVFMPVDNSGTTPTGVEQYYGSIDIDGQINWQYPVGKTSNPIGTCFDSIANQNGFCFELNSLTWTSVGKMSPAPTSTADIEVQLPQGFNAGNTMVFVTWDNQNSMKQATVVGNLATLKNVGVGQEVHIITVGASDGRLHAESTGIVVQPGFRHIIKDLPPSSLAQFADEMDRLP